MKCQSTFTNSIVVTLFTQSTRYLNLTINIGIVNVVTRHAQQILKAIKIRVETIRFVAPGGCPAASGAMPLRALLTKYIWLT